MIDLQTIKETDVETCLDFYISLNLNYTKRDETDISFLFLFLFVLNNNKVFEENIENTKKREIYFIILHKHFL